MTTLSLTDIEINRLNAVLTLYEMALTWDKEQYTEADFLLDKYLREVHNLPEKDIGKAPYNWLK